MSNYLSECNNGELRIDPKTFQQTWCARCSQKSCDLAVYVKTDPMAYRQATWRERFFGDNQADLNIPRFARVASIDFPDLLVKALKLEISERRGDWSVPEVPISDGHAVQASSETNQQVEEAVRQLRYSDDEGFEDPEIEPESQPELEPGPPLVIQERLQPRPQVARPTSGNLPDPGEVMIGGDPVPVKRDSPRQEVDPWAPPPKSKCRVVEVGATITLGGPKIND